MVSRSTLLVGICALWSASVAFPAQDTFRIEVDLVNVVATVTDADGAYVRGLTADDFIVEEDGVRQEISHFQETSDLPMTIGITLDTSASMVDRMRTALAALDRFVDGLHTDDEVFVTTFANRVSLAKERAAGSPDLAQRLNRVDVAGGTALYDAIVDAVRRAEAGRYDKRAVIVVTDGADTRSTLRLGDALEAVRRADVLVYGLGIDTVRFSADAEHVQFDWPLTPIPGVPGLRAPTGTDVPVDLGVLESFARASGAKAFLISGSWSEGTAGEIDVVLDEVTAELRSQYSLAYYPPRGSDGRLHQIRVRVPDRNYVVRTRTSYRSAEPR